MGLAEKHYDDDIVEEWVTASGSPAGASAASLWWGSSYTVMPQFIYNVK
jgi:hypothetical protein